MKVASIQHSEKMGEMVVNPNVGGYIVEP